MAKNNIMLHLRNQQFEESVEIEGDTEIKRVLSPVEDMELITEATVYTKPHSTYITYRESAKMDMEENRTLIKLLDDVLEVHRYEKKMGNGMELRLQQGKNTIVRYVLPYGALEIEMYTHKLERDLDENGYGRIFAEYSIRMGDQDRQRNRLELSLRPQ